MRSNSYFQMRYVKYISQISHFFISLQKGFEVVPFAGVPADHVFQQAGIPLSGFPNGLLPIGPG